MKNRLLINSSFRTSDRHLDLHRTRPAAKKIRVGRRAKTINGRGAPENIADFIFIFTIIKAVTPATVDDNDTN